MENPKGRRCSCPPCEKGITKSPPHSGACTHSIAGKEADLKVGASYRVRVEQLAWLECCKGRMQALEESQAGKVKNTDFNLCKGMSATHRALLEQMTRQSRPYR